jgi:hypothetical protein
LLMAASTSFAEAIPRYDVASYCRSVSDISAGLR